MDSVQKVLIVGGGIGGMATAILMREAGVAVDLIDIDPAWRVYGAGITITGPTLRAYRRLGMIEAIGSEGAIVSGARIRLFNGTVLQEFEEPALEEGLPATGGILRPVLHRIMSERTRAAGAQVRLGVSVEALTQDEQGVDVRFSDGSTGRYDLVVGADGINSGIRRLIFENAVEPRYTGQGSWRILAPRPPGLDKGEFYLGHENLVGITACAADKVYVFMLNPDPDRKRIAEEDQPAKVRDLLADFGGEIPKLRDGVGPQSSIVYRPLEFALQPRPWSKGRVILIGDAAHATTPHLASGAGMAVEDAVVLVEELKQTGRSLPEALNAYEERRFERCRFIVESSVEIGKLQLARAPVEAVGRAMSQALHALAAPF